eukprot:TRINITY_DN576_c0_g1_i1.p1 TRINITY_DN576_c0_g1~~TRINITY_DN576_c0_g1_i1.p1  ORF type:complete len:593 (-),score=124.86 TRINITY_DN576_c0_g1_i1:150-1724(-)
MGGHNPPFHGEFSSSRYALLFKPGHHQVTVNVGFYTSIIGLGTRPGDTAINEVQCENGDFDYTGGALANFWRSTENFATGNMLWAASQACPMRRVNVNGNLNLYQYNGGCCAGYASGGYLADSIISGNTVSGSQQQYFARNNRIGRWEGSLWNMVFVGNTGGIPSTHCGNTGGGAYTTIPQTPVIAEKPYISIDSGGRYTLRVPRVEYNKAGPTSNYDNVDQYDFSKVYVATASDSAAVINQKLTSGLHVVLSPGIYQLTDSITINRSNTTVLGIGWATLVSTTGKPAITVANVEGVRIAGILLQAGTASTPSLLRWGDSKDSGNSRNPGFLSDVFARVGGTNNAAQQQVQADVMVQINSGNVVIDNTWLWRADHSVGGEVVNSQNPCDHGLVVNGDDVTAYGLAVEHQLNDLVVWSGENGRTYFFQSELPYDVTQQNFGNPGYVGYRVANNVQNHHAYGVGVYSFFRDHSVSVANGFSTGSSSNVVFVNPFTKYLSGNGQITHVINGRGATVSQGGAQIAYVC